jgi:hypothetical protein
VAAGRETVGHTVRRMAADLCNRLNKPERELHHLEHAPLDDSSSRRRLELRYEQYLKKPAVTATEDAEGDWLLEQFRRLCPPDARKREKEERDEAKKAHLRAAMIHLHRGDLHRRAEELWKITELDFADMDALFLYGLSLRDYEAQNAGGPLYGASETMTLLLSATERRLKALKEAGVFDDEDVRIWTERFQSLRFH